MGSNDPILVRCAGCKWNFETRTFGKLECPLCHQEIWIEPPPGYEAAPATPDEAPPPATEEPEPAPAGEGPSDREPEDDASAPQDEEPSGDTEPASGRDEPPLGVVLKMLEEKMRARREGAGVVRPAWVAGAGNVFSRFTATTRQVLAGPTRFFAGLRIESTRGAWTFGWIVCTLAVALFAVYQLWQFDGNRAAIVEMLRVRSPDVDPQRFLETFHTLLVISLYGAPVLGLVNLFATAALYHLGILLSGRDHRGFAATLHATAYGFTPLLLTAVPVIGHLVGGLWSLIVQAVGLARVHRVANARGALAVTVPLLLIMLLTLGLL